jgi:serine/threonine protein kinase
MPFPESLKNDFDVLDSGPQGGILPCYRVRERKPFGREFTLRLLPEAFCGDKGIVDDFHDFFTRFAEISNKTNIPQVYSVTGAVNGPVYVLEEYVSGITLTEFADNKGHSRDFSRDVIEVLSKVCEALHFAHQKGLYHLTIGPEDITIDELNGRVKLVGFGAQVFSQNSKVGLLPDDAKQRLAPEVLTGASLKPCADVFSLANVIKDVCPEIFSNTKVLAEALSKDPSERYQTTRDFESALSCVMECVGASNARHIDTPVEAKGGLRPVFAAKSTTTTTDVNHPPTNQQQVNPILETTGSFTPTRVHSLKVLAGVVAGLIVFVVSLVIFSNHEKQSDLARSKETQRIAALEKEKEELKKQIEKNQREMEEQERLSRLAQERMELEREKEELRKQQEKLLRDKEEQVEKEQELSKIKEAQRIAALEKEKQNRDAEISRMKTQADSVQDKSSTGVLRLYDQRKKFPNLVLKKGSDHTVSVRDFLGKVVILYFWSIHIPDREKFELDLSTLMRSVDTNKIEILAINLVDPPQAILKHVTGNPLPFLVLRGGKGFSLEEVKLGGKNHKFLVNPSREAICEVPSLPTTYMIDSQGNAVGYCIGPVQWERTHNRNLVQELVVEIDARLPRR